MFVGALQWLPILICKGEYELYNGLVFYISDFKTGIISLIITHIIIATANGILSRPIADTKPTRWILSPLLAIYICSYIKTNIMFLMFFNTIIEALIELFTYRYVIFIRDLTKKKRGKKQ